MIELIDEYDQKINNYGYMNKVNLIFDLRITLDISR